MIKKTLTGLVLISLASSLNASEVKENYFADHFSDKIHQEEVAKQMEIERKIQLAELRKKQIEDAKKAEEERQIRSGKRNLYFFGVEAGIANTKVNGTSDTVGVYNSLEVNRGHKFAGLKFGRNFESGRIYVELDQYNVSTLTSDKFVSKSVNFDYYLRTKKDLKPFIGLTVAQNDFIDSEISYGAGFGFINQINDSFDIEMGYKLNYLGETQTVTVPYNGVDETANIELKYFHKFYIGLNYKF